MLLSVTVENFRSYDKSQTLSLIASDNNGINAVKVNNLNIRKSAVIYGANASGKSNLLKVISMVQNLLQRDLYPSLYQPFFSNQGPSKFSIDFEIDNQIFTYSLAFDADKIHEESLLDGDDQLICSRTIVDKSKSTRDNYTYQMPQQEFLLNKDQLTVDVANTVLKGWQTTTTEKQLFLRQRADYGSEKLRSLVNWLLTMVVRNNPYMANNNDPYSSGKDLMFASTFYANNINQNDLINTFNTIGAGFKRLEVIDEPVILPDGNKTYMRKLNSHYTHNGKDCTLNFADESDGTIKFYNYFALIKRIAVTGGVIIIDELEAHLHPLLVEEIIRAVHNADSKAKAQLIFTTHNPILLNDTIFERDQIYFTEKNDNQATELYSLADFTDLQEGDDIQNKYMAGRFGAIPYMHYINLVDNNNG